MITITDELIKSSGLKESDFRRELAMLLLKNGMLNKQDGEKFAGCSIDELLILEAIENDISNEWKSELEQRVKDIDSGKMKIIPMEEVMARLKRL